MIMLWLKIFGRCSNENQITLENFESIQQARIAIFDWINWYNQERIHSSLGYVSPALFEAQLLDRSYVPSSSQPCFHLGK